MEFIGRYVNLDRIKLLLKKKVLAFLIVVLVAGTSVPEIKAFASDLAASIIQGELDDLLAQEEVLDIDIIRPVF